MADQIPADVGRLLAGGGRGIGGNQDVRLPPHVRLTPEHKTSRFLLQLEALFAGASDEVRLLSRPFLRGRGRLVLSSFCSFSASTGQLVPWNRLRAPFAALLPLPPQALLAVFVTLLCTYFMIRLGLSLLARK